MMYRSLFIVPLLLTLSACNLPTTNKDAETTHADSAAHTTSANQDINGVEIPNEQGPDTDAKTINPEYAAELKRFVEDLHPKEMTHYCDEAKPNSSVRTICNPEWCKSDVNIYEVNNGQYLYHVFSYFPSRVLGVVEYQKEFSSYAFNAAIPYVEKNLTEFNPQFSGSLNLEGKTEEGHLLPWTKVSAEGIDNPQQITTNGNSKSVITETKGNICIYDVHNPQANIIFSIPFNDKAVLTTFNAPANTETDVTVYTKQYEEEIWTLRVSKDEFVNHYPVVTLVLTKAVTKYGTKNNKKVTDRKLSETVIGKYTYVTDAEEYFLDK